MAHVQERITRADLEKHGFRVEEAPYQPDGGDTEEMDMLNKYLPEPPPAKKRDKEDTMFVLKVIEILARVITLRVFLYAAGAGSFFCFYKVLQEPELWKTVGAVAFTVLVFLPTLYYDKNFR